MDIQKSIRENQLLSKVHVAKVLLGDIQKAKGGIYENNEENRKLGRVGQKYGRKKEENNSILSKFGKVEINKLGSGIFDWNITVDGRQIQRGMRPIQGDFKEFKKEVIKEIENSDNLKKSIKLAYVKNKWEESKNKYNLLDEKEYAFSNHIFYYQMHPNWDKIGIPRWVRHPDEYGTEDKAEQWEDWSDQLMKIEKFVNS